MTNRNRESTTATSTSFPDLLGEEEARLTRRSYPSEVTIGRSKRDEMEADGLLDELLNDDDDTLTASHDGTNNSHNDQNKPKQEVKKTGANNSNYLGGLLSVPAKETTRIGTTVDSKKPKRVTYADDVKVTKTLSSDVSSTDSDRSSGRDDDDEEEEAVEILIQEDELLGDEKEASDDEEDVSDYEFNDEDEGNDDDNDEDESVDSDNSGATQDLLERAHDRLNLQGLYEEVAQLRNTIERKDKEIEELSGQLRRAVATKCDLVIAHTELERHHEYNLKQLEEASKQLLKANFGLVEEQADTDVQLMNEIVRLNQEMKEMKTEHIHELGDWERLHANEMRDKEYEIAKLEEEVRKLKVGTTHGRKQKKLLGMARQ
mmetsp:Transcript_16845/g.31504  ORF Transcript_16845/g.31504 Transcript_16845/m.31504 type:complete len:375 (+) Transcript_16845:122-1246(+)